MPFSDDLKNIFTRNGNGLTRIIFINVIVFLVVNIIDQFIRFTGSSYSLIKLFALPGDITLATKHFWTFLSYMFLHEELFHILFNMLWLYWLGKIFVEYLGSKRLVGVYLLGGLSGGILYIFSSLLFPSYFNNTLLLGASAGVMAVVIATAVLLPEYVIYLLFFGGVKLKYLALVAFVITSVIDFSQNTGGKISHIGGALFGMLFMLQYKKGIDITKPLNTFFDKVISLFSHKSKIKISGRRRISDEEYNHIQKIKQEKIDRILDKISKAGYESLTKEEKDFLFKASGKN
jgi:membrane associated rhomboid family serine protease